MTKVEVDDKAIDAILVCLYTLDIAEVRESIRIHSSNELDIALDVVEAAEWMDLPALMAGTKQHVREVCK